MITKEQLEQIAKENPKGFTIDLEGQHVIGSTRYKWAVALKETQGFTTADYDKLMKYARKTNFIGGWEDEGIYYIDAVDIYPSMYPKETILKIARHREQLAIFDMETLESTYL